MPGHIFIENALTTLRTIERDDVSFIAKNGNDPEMRLFLGHRIPETAEQVEEAFVNDDDDSVSLLVCVDEELVGLVGLSARSPTSQTVFGLTGVVEIGLWISPNAQGEGYGRAAADSMISYAFDDLRLHKVSARVFAFNGPSKSLFEDALGFREEGIQRDEIYLDRTFHDVHYYGVLCSEWHARD